jgi:hypothetical protein
LDVVAQSQAQVAARCGKEGFDAIERGHYVSLNSDKELKKFLRKIREEGSTKPAADRKRG